MSLDPMNLQSGVNTGRLLESENDFDTLNGFCFVWMCLPPIWGWFIPPCAYSRVSTQKLYFDGNNRLHYKYDCCLIKTDKLIPLDRIQDINISSNVFSRCCCVSLVEIQTAGSGGNGPEALIIAPKNPERLRELIMTKRDEAAGTGYSSHDGVGGAIQSPLNGPSGELVSIRESLLRIEKHIERGVEKLP